MLAGLFCVHNINILSFSKDHSYFYPGFLVLVRCIHCYFLSLNNAGEITTKLPVLKHWDKVLYILSDTCM